LPDNLESTVNATIQFIGLSKRK